MDYSIDVVADEDMDEGIDVAISEGKGIAGGDGVGNGVTVEIGKNNF